MVGDCKSWTSQKSVVVTFSSSIYDFNLLFHVGASIPSFCLSNAMGWRLNFALQILVSIIRMVLLIYIIYGLATQFADVQLSSIRICLLAVVVLSTCSLTPLFHISYRCKWLMSLRPIEDNFRSNDFQANKAREVRESKHNFELILFLW